MNYDVGTTVFGDSEFIADLFASSPRHTCAKPLLFEARSVVNGTPAELTGESFIYYDNVKGLYCANYQQDDNLCLDYEVRMCCPGI